MIKTIVLAAASVIMLSYAAFNFGYNKGHNEGLVAGFSSGSRVEAAKQTRALEGCEVVASKLLEDAREAEMKVKRYEELFNNIESVFGK